MHIAPDGGELSSWHNDNNNNGDGARTRGRDPWGGGRSSHGPAKATVGSWAPSGRASICNVGVPSKAAETTITAPVSAGLFHWKS